MSNIIRLPHDPHHEAQLLLPWYVKGRLQAEDLARVEAHLKTCSDCQRDLKSERRLGEEVAGLPVDVELGWASMLDRITPSARLAQRRSWLVSVGRVVAGRARRAAPWLGWALAAPAFLLLVAVSVVDLRPKAGPYHTLGAAPASAAGNLVVIFRPDTSEAAMRQTLKQSEARLVDGPTAADAYVLHVPAVRRDRILASLRAEPVIVLAEPIDAAGQP